MDPNECLARIIEAACSANSAELQEATADLVEWFQKFGFSPDLATVSDILVRRGSAALT